ncbi:Acetyltransferase (GNAT) family protein [Micromonospora pattaloongensis]|uniref:Acetyltransferase (GNAT) family protein n=1 Tax=Micromonospora pattaloongensis TaxID=405436 RepID=A0A1H3H011_9ACTN|nr:GNAT family N-acetyltransferase [Micromonospora pattaloongensis]SDY08811.1 Acetyltransferase (GNAT) family protein [Micromonospora pattaloongensis]
MDPEFSIEELTDADLPAVVALCGAALDLPEDATEAAQIVSCLWGGAGSARAFGFAALVGGALRGVVLASVGRRDASAGHIDLVAVHPAARRRGIARALLRRAESALAARGVTDVWLAGNPPHYAWPGIDVRYTPAVCAALALGYGHERTAWNMTAELSAPESPARRPTAPAERRLAAAGVTVRAATVDDLPALTAFADTAFGGSWAGELAGSVARPGAGCHLAERDGELLGFAAYGSCRPSWFGPMGTAPAARGLGIGGVLLRRCLRDQHAAGQARAEIGWVGPVEFYADNAGAWIRRVFFLYRKEL